MIFLKNTDGVPRKCRECQIRCLDHGDRCYESENHPLHEFYDAYDKNTKPSWCPCMDLDDEFCGLCLIRYEGDPGLHIIIRKDRLSEFMKLFTFVKDSTFVEH